MADANVDVLDQMLKWSRREDTLANFFAESMWHAQLAVLTRAIVFRELVRSIVDTEEDPVLRDSKLAIIKSMLPSVTRMRTQTSTARDRTTRRGLSIGGELGFDHVSLRAAFENGVVAHAGWATEVEAEFICTTGPEDAGHWVNLLQGSDDTVKTFLGQVVNALKDTFMSPNLPPVPLDLSSTGETTAG